MNTTTLYNNAQTVSIKLNFSKLYYIFLHYAFIYFFINYFCNVCNQRLVINVTFITHSTISGEYPMGIMYSFLALLCACVSTFSSDVKFTISFGSIIIVVSSVITHLKPYSAKVLWTILCCKFGSETR